MLILEPTGAIETTEEDFMFYIQEFKYYMQVFNLLNWEVNFQWEEMPDARAAIQINVAGKIATTCFNKRYDFAYDESEISKCAFHECMELLIGELSCAAEERYSTHEQIEAATHTIIRTLENVIWEQEWQSRETEVLAEKKSRERKERSKRSKKPSKSKSKKGGNSSGKVQEA